MFAMSLRNFILISLVEEFLFVFVTLTLAGRKDMLRLTNWRNAVRVFAATIGTALVSVLLHNYMRDFAAIMFLQTILYIVIYCLVLKVKWYEVSAPFMLAFICSVVTEFLSVLLVTNVTGVTYQELRPADWLFIVFPLPGRLAQIVAAVLLYRLNVVVGSFSGLKKVHKLFTGKVKVFLVCLLLNFTVIAGSLNSFIYDLRFTDVSIFDIIRLLVTVVASALLLVFQVIYSVQLSKQIARAQEEQMYTLEWVLSMIEEGMNPDTIKHHLKNAIKMLEEDMHG